MSAFIVSDNHLAYLVHAGLAYGRQSPLRWQAPDTEEPPGESDYAPGNPWGETSVDTMRRKARELTQETADSTMLLLYAANVASVNYRYDNRDGESVDHIPHYRDNDIRHINPVQVLKALACYEYQSCETPEWDASEAHAFCEALRHRMIQVLPGYEEATWGID